MDVREGGNYLAFSGIFISPCDSLRDYTVDGVIEPTACDESISYEKFEELESNET